MKKNLFCWFLISFQMVFAQYAVSEIPENLLKNANAVVRSDSDIYTLKSVNEMEVQKKYAITILQRSGDDFSSVYIHYNPLVKVNNIKVNLYDASGKLMKTYTKKDFGDFTYNASGALYVDERIMVLKPASTMYPFTVETMYDIKTSNTINIGTFVPFQSFDIALQKADMTIVNNSGIKIRTKITDNDFGKVKISESGNSTVYQYENIPAIKEQQLAPTFSTLIPKVEFSPQNFTLAGKQGDLTSWDNFGKWYYTQLLQPSSIISPEISKEIAALNLTGSTSDKVKTIYQYMQNKTRYVLISMGIGGWQPMNASEVSQKGYGDCKALTNYMRTLLSAAGINSYYAVIYNDRTEQKFDKNFPELNGNHVILMVPTEKGNLWLENTSQKIAFNHLGFESLNRNVLLVKENGIEIMDTPIYQPDESKEIMEAEVLLNPDNSIKSSIKLAYTGGQYDYAMRLLTLRNDELKDYIKNNYYGLKIGNVEVENLANNRDNAQINLNMHLQATDFSKKLGEDIFFPVVPFSKTSQLNTSEERLLPFETYFPFQDEYTIEYIAPIGYSFSDLPAPVSFKNEFGSYTLKFELNDQKLKVVRVLSVNKGFYPKEKFKDFAAFRKQIASMDNTKILIKKT